MEAKLSLESHAGVSQLPWKPVRAAGRWLTERSCSEEYIQQHKEERFVKADVKKAISGERMENWQTAFLIDVGCCNSDSLGSAQNAVSGLHFTFSSIWLVRSATHVMGWAITTSIFLWTWVFLDLIIRVLLQIYIAVSSFGSFIALVSCKVYRFAKCCSSCHTCRLHDFTPCTFRLGISFLSNAGVLVNTVTITNGKGWTTACMKLTFQKSSKEIDCQVKYSRITMVTADVLLK